MEPHNTHNFKHLYSGIYPDGSKISTKLCHGCGLVELLIGRTDGIESYFYLGQAQVNELAYALLKGNNRFTHIQESQALPLPPVPIVPPEDIIPPNPIRIGA